MLAGTMRPTMATATAIHWSAAHMVAAVLVAVVVVIVVKLDLRGCSLVQGVGITMVNHFAEDGVPVRPAVPGRQLLLQALHNCWVSQQANSLTRLLSIGGDAAQVSNMGQLASACFQPCHLLWRPDHTTHECLRMVMPAQARMMNLGMHSLNRPLARGDASQAPNHSRQPLHARVRQVGTFEKLLTERTKIFAKQAPQMDSSVTKLLTDPPQQNSAPKLEPIHIPRPPGYVLRSLLLTGCGTQATRQAVKH